MDMYGEFKIGWCPICDQGWVTIQKDTVVDRLFVYCDECLMGWKCPDDIEIPNTGSFCGTIQTKHDDIVHLLIETLWGTIRTRRNDIVHLRIETPTYDEIKEYKWDKFILNQN